MTADRAEGLDAGAPPLWPTIERDRRFCRHVRARIDGSVRRYRDEPGIDFAQASLAEALAWCLARLEYSCVRPRRRGQSEEDDARLFAANLLQKQQEDG